MYVCINIYEFSLSREKYMKVKHKYNDDDELVLIDACSRIKFNVLEFQFESALTNP